MFTRKLLISSLFTFNFEQSIIIRIRKMSSSDPFAFIQKLNPTSGKSEWITKEADYDYHQEIARAAYADMLHDHDRNMKYYEGLKIAVKLKHAVGQEAIVLDIGTGTGLLSMMAVSSGADKVFACEAFTPMADCASRVLQRNKMKDKITLIPKRSTDIRVGEGLDLPTRANILVTEVFDTELIGEGAIETFNHANKHLLTEDCIVIPTRGILFAQVVDCPLVPTWNSLQSINLQNGKVVKFPEEISRCAGVPSVHDVQLSEIKPEQFTKLSEPIPVFEFDWNNPDGPIPNFAQSTREFKGSNPGRVTCIFSWWDLIMDPLGQYTISCKPDWVGGADIAWRDHWMQAIYYHPKSLQIAKGKDYTLNSYHDEFSLWFEASEAQSLPSPPQSSHQRPICECGAHLALSRSRIGMWNDEGKMRKYTRALEKAINGRSDVTCLVLSECSPLAFIAAGLGAKKVFVLEGNSFSRKIMQEFIVFNKMEDRIVVLEKSAEEVTASDFAGLKIDIVVGDPFFMTAVLPWHNLFFWFSIQILKWSFSPDVKLIPNKGILKGIAVDFRDLWKIKAPVGKPCNGEWNLSDFDKLIARSSSRSDAPVDAQPLWEYPGIARSIPFSIQEFDLTKEITDVEASISVEGVKNFNGVAFWMDWVLGDEQIVSTGPVIQPELDKPISWDMNWKQGVYLTSIEQCSGTSEGKPLECDSSFKRDNGEVTFNFYQ